MHEMLRSFVTLAKFLNLTHAVNHLGSTRQTVRRHIEMLQSLRGEKLLAFVDRQYVLTREGELALVEAEQILQLDEAWMRKDIRVVNGLTAVLYDADFRGSLFITAAFHRHGLEKRNTAYTERAALLGGIQSATGSPGV